MSDEIERIRRDHIADPDGDPNDPHCVMCSDASYPIWPCDTALLLALLAERDAEVARLARTLRLIADTDVPTGQGDLIIASMRGAARAALAARGDQG